jgi:hypothetical protein
MVNKIWSPSFNLKHSSSDYIIKKRNQTLYQISQSTSPALYTYTNNSITFAIYPSYKMRKDIQDGKYVHPCTGITPCPEYVTDKYE